MSDPNDMLALEAAKLDERCGPSWRGDIATIREYGRSVGLSDGELDTLYDHRAVVALREAALAAKAKAERESATAKEAQAERERISADKAKAMKPCTARDAGRYLGRFLKGGGR